MCSEPRAIPIIAISNCNLSRKICLNMSHGMIFIFDRSVQNYECGKKFYVFKRSFTHFTEIAIPEIFIECWWPFPNMLPSRCATSRLVANKYFIEIMTPQSSISMKKVNCLFEPLDEAISDCLQIS